MGGDCPYCGKEFQLPKALRSHIGQSKLHREEVTTAAEKAEKNVKDYVNSLVDEAFKEDADGKGIEIQKTKIGVDLENKKGGAETGAGSAAPPSDDEGFTCADCEAELKKGQNYCPGCGAEMDWGEDEE